MTSEAEHGAFVSCYVRYTLRALDMHKWLNASAVMAALLAGAGALSHFAFVLPGIDAVPQHLENGPAERSSAVEDCLQAAQMVFAVHWAVACMAQVGQTPAADGNAECDLPDSKAAVVNAWLDRAEKECIAEARAGSEP